MGHIKTTRDFFLSIFNSDKDFEDLKTIPLKDSLFVLPLNSDCFIDKEKQIQGFTIKLSWDKITDPKSEWLKENIQIMNSKESLEKKNDNTQIRNIILKLEEKYNNQITNIIKKNAAQKKTHINFRFTLEDFVNDNIQETKNEDGYKFLATKYMKHFIFKDKTETNPFRFWINEKDEEHGFFKVKISWKHMLE